MTPAKDNAASASSALVKPAKPDEMELVGRFGSFFLTSPTKFPTPYRDVMDQIAEALEADVRVTDVRKPDAFDDTYSVASAAWPALITDPDTLIRGKDVMRTLRFSRPLRFQVNVPPKNQPRLKEGDAVPSQYDVMWDGAVVLVTWPVPLGAHIPMSGGHIVATTLRDVVSTLGYGLYVQACSPHCQHGFVHIDLRLTGPTEVETASFARGKFFGEVVVSLPAADPASMQRATFDALLLNQLTEFGRLKNLSQRILDLETMMRADLRSLLTINYGRAELPLLTPWKRIRVRWANKAWRSQSRQLIARIWLALAVLEQLLRTWTDIKFEFENGGVNSDGRDLLFERDYADDVARVEQLDVEPIRAGIAEAGIRLDNRAVALVTMAAGVIGGLAGVGLTALVGGG